MKQEVKQKYTVLTKSKILNHMLISIDKEQIYQPLRLKDVYRPVWFISPPHVISMKECQRYKLYIYNKWNHIF